MPSRNEDCPICFQPLGTYNGQEQNTAMGHQPAPGLWHAFHMGCIVQWQKNHSTCPVCRANVNPWLSVNLTNNAASASPSPTPTIEPQ
jgi:hypothetical protein